MAERQGFEESVLSRIGDMLDPLSEAVADTMGLPPGGKRYTTDEQLAEWNYSPLSDPDLRLQAMQQLVMGGKSDEEITDIIYPNRRRLQTTSRPKIDDQIRFSREMRKLMEQKAAEMPAAAPAPLSDPMSQGMSRPQAMPAPSVAAPQPAPSPAMPSMLDMPANAMLGD